MLPESRPEVQPATSALPDDAIDAARMLRDLLVGAAAMLRADKPDLAAVASFVNEARAAAEDLYTALEGVAVLEHRRQHAQAAKHISPSVAR